MHIHDPSVRHQTDILLKTLWEYFQEAFRELTGDSQQVLRRLSASSQETLSEFSETFSKLSGSSQQALRRLSVSSQDTLSKLSGSSQEALMKLSGSSLKQSVSPRPWNSFGSHKLMPLSAKFKSRILFSTLRRVFDGRCH